MQIIFSIIGFFLAGFISQRYISDSPTLVKRINYFIIYVSLPAIILLKVPQLEFSNQVIIPVVAAWVWLLCGVVLTLLLSRFFSWGRPLEGAMLLLVTMGNTSFLGYPMVIAFFDDTVLSYAIFFDQLGGFLILSTFGFIVVSLYSLPVQSAGHSCDSKIYSLNTAFLMLKRIMTFPPFISLIIALCLPIEPLVLMLEPALNVIAMMLMPASLYILGVQFQPRLLPEHKVPLFFAISLKLLMAPLVAAFTVYCLGGSIDVRNATVFESAMPSMVTPGLMAIAAGIAPRFVVTMLGYCTLVGFVTLPLLALYLNSI